MLLIMLTFQKTTPKIDGSSIAKFIGTTAGRETKSVSNGVIKGKSHKA